MYSSVHVTSVDYVSTHVFQSYDAEHALPRKFVAVPVLVRGVESHPSLRPRVPGLDPQRVRSSPVSQDHAAPNPDVAKDRVESLREFTAPSVPVLEKVVRLGKPFKGLGGSTRARVHLGVPNHDGFSGHDPWCALHRVIEPKPLIKSLCDIFENPAPLRHSLGLLYDIF